MDIEPTPHEIAELLWLRNAITAHGPGGPFAGDGPGGPAGSDDGDATTASSAPRTDGSPPRQPMSRPPKVSPVDGKRKALFVKAASGGAAASKERTVKASEVPVPRLSVARETERIARPLRRLKAVDGSRPLRVLDEELTADATAESGRLTPILRPVSERWFDLALVVDIGTSMILWDETVRDFQRSCQRLGVFRDVRTWQLGQRRQQGRREFAVRPAPNRGSPLTAASAWRQLGQLRDPAGRRLVLILTDGVADPWRQERTVTALAQIGAANPTVIVQVLPQRIWHRTRLRPSPALWARTSEAVAALTIRPVTAPDVPGSWVPVIRFSEDWLDRWVDVLTGPAGRQSLGMAIGLPQGGSTPLRGDRPAPRAAGQLVDGFLATASTDAARLATYLAAAPLTLPVMRLVQTAMLPTSDPGALAEVFLSGLIRQVRPSDEADHIHFDFQRDVRRELLSVLARTEALQVLDVLSATSEEIAAEFGGTLDFQALVRDVGGPGSISVRARPFALVASRVLRSIGGDYRRFAETLDEGLRSPRASAQHGKAANRGRQVPPPAPADADLVDDLDGSPADGTVQFSLDGVDYEIRLSATNADHLRQALDPFRSAAARIVRSGKPRRDPR